LHSAMKAGTHALRGLSQLPDLWAAGFIQVTFDDVRGIEIDHRSLRSSEIKIVESPFVVGSIAGSRCGRDAKGPGLGAAVRTANALPCSVMTYPSCRLASWTSCS